MSFLDLELLKEAVKYTKHMIETEPWKSLVVREVDPGKEYSSDEEIKGQFAIHIFGPLLSTQCRVPARLLPHALACNW